MFQYFFFSPSGERKSKKESGEETKTDNEKWKLIEEEQEIRKTNYVKIFLEADKRKNNKKGFKKTKLQKQTKETLFWKKLPKRKLAKRHF